MSRTARLAGIMLVGATTLIACGSEPLTTPVTGNTADVPDAFDRFSGAVTIAVEDGYVVLRSTGEPDHGSPYFQAGDSRYEAYDGENLDFELNPNRIAEQQLTFRIPLTPGAAGNNQATPLGPIGIATNGVPIFNQYAGPNRPLTFEIDSFDQYNGHPQQTGQYHYHVEPVHLTRADDGVLVGFLLDGFPVYGPREDGSEITNADLDEFHGHFGTTPDYPGGVYHYHVTAQDPYINGSGFYGTPGTVSW